MDLSARGKKRRCMECGEAFYDLNRDPAPCPYCGHVHPLDAFTASRRPAPAPAPEPKAVDDIEDDEDIEDEEDDAVIDDNDLDDDGDNSIANVAQTDGDDED